MLCLYCKDSCSCGDSEPAFQPTALPHGPVDCCRGVHAKCNFPLPEEEAFQAQLLASQQESWQGGQASPPAAPPPLAPSQAAFSEAVSIPCNEAHSVQPRSAVQVSKDDYRQAGEACSPEMD